MRSCIFAICLLLCYSCNEDVVGSTKKPDNILSQEKLIPILTEVTIIEGAYQMKYVQVSRYSSLLQKEADSIFNVFQIDRQTFESSMKYYSQHPEEMKNVYAGVKQELEKRKATLESEPQMVVVDSTVVATGLNSKVRLRTDEDIR